MFQPATIGLCVSLLAELFPVGPGVRVDFATGARAELNVGRVPVTSIQDSAPGTEETVVLRSGFRLVSPTSTFSVAYRPRYYLRLPDVLEVGRPLLLHDGDINWSAALGRRSNMAWRLHSSAGELSNSSLQVLFDPGTGRPSASVVPIFRLDTTWSLSAATAKHQTTDLAFAANHNDSFGDSSAFERSENLSATLSHSIALSRRTSVGLSTQAGYVWPETTAESATIGAQLFMSQRVLEAASWRVALGLSQGWALGGDVAWPLPTLDAGYTTIFHATGQTWNLNLRGGTRAFFDMTSALYRPQVFAAVGVSAQILSTWTVALDVTFSTDISRSEQTTSGQPTQFNFDLPVTYRLGPSLRLSFGVRLGLSAPPLSAWDSGRYQDQVSAFLALDWGAGTERSRGGWL